MDASQIRSRLKDLRDLPLEIWNWKIEQGQDATCDDAIWIWAVIEQDESDPKKRAVVRKRVREALRGGDQSTDLIYVRFRTTSEEEATS